MKSVNHRRTALAMSLAAALFLFISVIGAFYDPTWLFLGLLLQLQMIITIYLTLRYYFYGYILAVSLNLIGLAFIVRQYDAGAGYAEFQGLFYVDIMIALSIIALYALRNQKNFKEVLRQKEQVSKAYYQAAVSEEKLYQKNKQLEQSNQIIERDRKQIYELAYIDPLSGLPNRRKFQQFLKTASVNALRDGQPFSLVFMDFDNFKQVNDTMGHHTGDELIRKAAQYLKEWAHPADVLAHIGGDEFTLMILRPLERPAIAAYLGKMTEKLNQPMVLGDKKVVVTACFGVTTFLKDTGSTVDLLKFADTAMYQAKAGGKNRICFFEKSLFNELITDARLEQELRKALINQELFLVFQPQYFVPDGRLRGFETLIRWQSSEFGLVSPARFIPIAEHNGQIVEIGKWIMRETFRTFKLYQDQHLFSGKLAVNVSAVQAMAPDFVTTVRDLLRESGFDPTQLEFEITETAFDARLERVRHVISELRSMGASVALDDFGTGYSSLNYLQKLPFDLVKIDKAFIDKIHTDLKSNQFVSTIISMLHQMNLPVLAEGVETGEQNAFLDLNHCDIIQGYLYGRPMRMKEVDTLLRKGSPETGHQQ
jgi:diguanylate cyclase (GGDEF)-like protein